MTVLERTIQALKTLGGQATYAQIYAEYERLIGYSISEGQEAGIRATIERNSSDSAMFAGTDLFYSVCGKGKGVWGLR